MTTTEVSRSLDHQALLWAEVDDIGALLHELDDADLDAASLCDGWRVRDVVGHLAYGHTTPMASFLAALVRYRFDVPRGSYELSIAFADRHDPDGLREVWDRELVEGRSRKGVARLVRWPEGFLDHFIHDQDLRRPLGRPRTFGEEQLVAALELLPRVKTPLFATKPVVAGLRLEATDVGWSSGDGPTVAGPAEAVVLAVAGRRVALAELEGDGVTLLDERTALA